MYKGLIILYLACFGCYVLFTRQPDYFDGEEATAVIDYRFDPPAARTVPWAVYQSGSKNYMIDARYLFRAWKNGDKTVVIYDTNDPSKAAVYLVWGYWITWKELAASLVLSVILFQVAVAITKNPSAEALIEQLESKPGKKRRYTD